MNGNTSFAHRLNGNGTHDSICTSCFVTVANLRDESELAPHERNHICDPVLFYQARENPLARHELQSWLSEISSSRATANRD
jgi:hypothetical protein